MPSIIGVKSRSGETCGMGRAEVTPDALGVFASLIDDLGKIDRESNSEADGLRNLAVAHIMLAIEGRSLTIYPLLQQVFAFALDWPQERRRKLSPRLDLSGAQTYADVAKVAYTALLQAAEPILTEMIGPPAPTDVAAFPRKH